jgi:hypothetical protein
LGMGLKGTLPLCVRMISHTRRWNGFRGLPPYHGMGGGLWWGSVEWRLLGSPEMSVEGVVELVVPTGPVKWRRAAGVNPSIVTVCLQWRATLMLGHGEATFLCWR